MPQRLRTAALVMAVLTGCISVAFLIHDLILPGELDAGQMDLWSIGNVSPGWSAHNSSGDLAASFQIVPGWKGTAQQISTEMGSINAAVLSVMPLTLSQHPDKHHILSFRYRRSGTNSSLFGASVGLSRNGARLASHGLPVVSDWTYVELLLDPHPKANAITFWVGKEVTLTIDEVGIRVALDRDLNDTSRWDVEQGEGVRLRHGLIQTSTVSHGLFTSQFPGFNVGSMDELPDSTAVAGGWEGWNRERVPFSESHSIIFGRTGGSAQRISTVDNGVLDSGLLSYPTFLQAPSGAGEYTLSFWYRLRIREEASESFVAIRNVQQQKNVVLLPLKPSQDWQYQELRFSQPDGPAIISFRVSGKGVELDLDDVSLVNQRGIAGYQQHQILTKGLPAMDTSATERPPLVVRDERGKLALVPDLPSRVAFILRDSMIPIILLLISILVIALLHAHGFTLFVGLSQGVVSWEPAPADMIWLLWSGRSILHGLDWHRVTRYRPIVLSLGALLLANLISLVSSASPSLTYFAITLYSMSLFFSLVLWVHDSEGLKWLKLGLIGSAVMNALIAVATILIPGEWSTWFARYGRVFGLFKDPNVMGPFLVSAWVLIQTNDFVAKSRSGKVVHAIVQVLLVTGVVMSQSRAAIGSLLAAVLVLSFLRIRRRRLDQLGTPTEVIVPLSIGLMAVVGFYWLSIEGVHRFSLMMPYDANLRFPVQLAGLKTGLVTPLGIGPGAFESHFNLSAHSLYIRTLVENGWMGFLAIMGFLAYTVVTSWRRMSGRYPSDLDAMFAWTISSLLNSLVIDTLHWRHFWVMLGVLWCSLCISDEKDVRDSQGITREMLGEKAL